MKRNLFKTSLHVSVDAGRLWGWHLQPGAFERLAPPWQRLVLEKSPGQMEAGREVVFRMKKGPFSMPWRALIKEWDPPVSFVDAQESGPFAFWEHRHHIREEEAGSTLVDHVEYALPRAVSRLPGLERLARKEIERLFAMRHRRMKGDLERFPEAPPGEGTRLLVSGASGLIGSRLVPYLKTLGFEVRELSRSRKGPGCYQWDPDRGRLDPAALKEVDGVIHLAGENIAGGIWTKARKRRILQSRIAGTRCLVEAVTRMDKKPKVFLSASGVNVYAFDDTVHDEDAPPGESFLSEVCQRWEAEALRVRDAGVRCVCLRTGIVLDPLGGALGKMLPAFGLGLGGPIGSGRQGFPWIGIDELLDIYVAGLLDARLSGAVNAVNPQRVDQRTFSKVLGKTLGMPAVLPLPSKLVALLLGQMGKETLLANLFVHPARLEAIDFPFRHDSLQEALRFLLGR